MDVPNGFPSTVASFTFPSPLFPCYFVSSPILSTPRHFLFPQFRGNLFIPRYFITLLCLLWSSIAELFCPTTVGRTAACLTMKHVYYCTACTVRNTGNVLPDRERKIMNEALQRMLPRRAQATGVFEDRQRYLQMDFTQEGKI